MGSEREPDEGKEMRDMREGEGADLAEVHGDDPGLDAEAVHDPVANSLVGERDAYIPVESFKRQATALLVYGGRLGGPIGTLLGVAGNAIEMAVERYEREYGPFDDGPAPDYHDYQQADHGEEVWHEPSE